MKRPLGKLIRLLGCMTILLLLIGLFFGIFFEDQDTAGFFGAIGSVAAFIYIILGFIYTVMIP